MQPTTTPQAIHTLNHYYDMVYQHSNADYQNYIGVINIDNSSTVYFDLPDLIEGNPQLHHTIAQFYDEPITSLSHIGNILVLSSPTNVYYAFWNGNTYTYLGALPEIGDIKISINQRSVVDTQTQKEETQTGEELKKYTIDRVPYLRHLATLKDSNTPELISGHQLYDSHLLRYAIRLYDGTLIHHSAPILVHLNEYIKFNIEEKLESWDQYRFHKNHLRITTHTYQATIHYDNSHIHEQWKDIIEGIDFFLSPPLGFASANEETIELQTETFTILDGASEAGGKLSTRHKPTIKIKQAIENLKSNSTYHYIHSTRIGESGTFLIPDTSNPQHPIIALTTQEAMTDDPFSHHKIGADISTPYNQKQHLASIKTTLFAGFHATHFPLSAIDEPHTHNVVIRTTFTINGEAHYSYTPKHTAPAQIAPIISYPDSRATHITIYSQPIASPNASISVIEIPLTPHPTLNISSYYSPDNMPINIHSSTNSIYQFPIPQQETIYEANKLKVSDPSNPFTYPTEQTYTIGTGRILAIASNAIRISEGQFGEYPLYAFTTTGIYAMHTNAVGGYTRTSPVSHEIPTSEHICHTPFGIVFLSTRGVCLISGQSVMLLSQSHETPPISIKLHTPHQDIIKDLPHLHKFISDGKVLITYNHHNAEIIISRADNKIAFVFNFNTKQWYHSSTFPKKVVQNTHPQMWLRNNQILSPISRSQQSQTNITIVTRPLMFRNSFTKIITRTQLHSTLDNAEVEFLLYGSMDGVNFRPISGLKLPRNNYHRIETHRIANAKYTHYMFVLSGNVATTSRIYHIISTMAGEYIPEIQQ